MKAIAKILKANGTDGAVLIGIRDVVWEEIKLTEPVFIYFDGLPVPFFIQKIQPKGTNKAIIEFNDLSSLKDAEEIVGREVFLDIECEDELAEEDFTGWTLLCRGKKLGTVTAMELFPGNPCLCLGPDVLIPLNEELLISCDPKKRSLDMDLPDGLL